MKQILKETAFEVQILKWFAIKYPQIAGQINLSKIIKREYSGAGFFFEIAISKNADRIDEKIKTLDGPQIKNDKLDFGGGSILFLENGYIKTLELFAYGNNFPEELGEFELQ